MPDAVQQAASPEQLTEAVNVRITPSLDVALRAAAAAAGQTPAEAVRAALRAYVAATIGEEVDDA